VIPLIHLVSDKRWMGQYAIGPRFQAAAWIVAGTIAALNLKLVLDELLGWLRGGGSYVWVVWTTAVPLAVVLVALLAYVTVRPIVWRLRGVAAPEPEGVHGPNVMPAVEPAKAPRRIAAAVDFTPADGAVLSQAVALAHAGGRGATVTLLHVVESGGARLMGGEMEDNEARADQQRLELYRSELAELGVEATYDLGFGEPAEQLGRLVEGHGSDLLVLGGHGHRGVADLVHGTTVERVRHLVRIPVLVVPGSS
jgi:manganese transport protein